MVFDGSGEVRPGIEEDCNSCVVLGEDLDDFCSILVIGGGDTNIDEGSLVLHN